jgi:hypothetical protein
MGRKSTGSSLFSKNLLKPFLAKKRPSNSQKFLVVL